MRVQLAREVRQRSPAESAYRRGPWVEHPLGRAEDEARGATRVAQADSGVERRASLSRVAPRDAEERAIEREEDLASFARDAAADHVARAEQRSVRRAKALVM